MVMDRRRFLKITATGAMVAISPSLLNIELKADNGELFKTYEKVLLIDETGKPITVGSLKPEVTYVFNYPYNATPSFIMDIGISAKETKLRSAEGEEYLFKGGIGEKNSIVAYSAICSHQLAHPTPEDSFITYIGKNKKTMACDRGNVIVCSSHMSAFAAEEGAKNIAGPAPGPLATIVLEEEPDGKIYAVAVLGKDLFHEYFKSFRPEFKKFYKNRRFAKKKVKQKAIVMELEKFSKDIIQY